MIVLAKTSRELDFDARVKLFNSNPRLLMLLFERSRNAFLSSLSFERQVILMQFQWRLDAEMRKMKNPIVRMNYLGNEMMSLAGQLAEALHAMAFLLKALERV